MRNLRDYLHLAVFPLVGVAVILGLWQAYVILFEINQIVLPSPVAIYHASNDNFGLLLEHAWVTALACILGFALALGVGIPLAVLIANSRILNLTLYPILIATQSVPKVAVAPIILIWFGIGLESKLAIAFLVAFFPIVVDTATGLRDLPPRNWAIQKESLFS